MADPYDSSDEALFRLVDVDEVDRLLGASGRPVARDTAKLTHLLTRVRKTLEADRETIAGLHRHIAQVSDQLQRVGQATTLNPIDALRYLDDEQRELLFDRIARDRLSMLRAMVDQAENAHTELVAVLDQVRSATAAMVQRPDLPGDVRAEFARLAAALPTEVRNVHRPPLLDFPDPEPLPSAHPAVRVRETAAPASPATIQDRSPWEGPAPVPSPPLAPLQVGAGASETAPNTAESAGGTPDEPHDASRPTAAAPSYVDPYGTTEEAVYVDPYGSADDAQVYVDPWETRPSPTPPDSGRADAGLDSLFD